MKRAFILVVGIWIALASCTERLICPAYQSAYIYDKDELRKKFSYFIDDSTPKVYTASKNKYLIAEPVSYARKVRSMQTVAMKPVRVVVPDSISGKGSADSVTMDEMRRATQSVVDSTFIVDVPRDSVPAAPLDSIYVITKDKELRLLKYNSADSLDYDSIQQKYVRQKPQYYVTDVRYNLEQDHYMWYLRDVLVLPDVKLAKNQQKGDGSGPGGKTKEKKGLKGFFKNLFKKKQKAAAADTTAAPPTEEFDYIDEADTLSQAETPLPGQVDQKPKKEKKGLFGKKKDKPVKKKKEDPKKETDPAEKKKEDEDDGF
jgi:hypothetical protein